MTRHSSDDEQLREPDNGGMPAVKPCTPAEYAADLTFIVDANMAIRSVNRLPAGRRPDDVLQNSVLSVVSSEHRDALKGTFRQALDTGEVKSTDVVLDLPDCRGHFRVHLYPLASGADDGDAIAMTATDISEHAATKERLQQIARERSALLDALPNHAILHSPDLKIVWPNEAACRSVDPSREELIGRHCYQVSMERDDPCPDCPVMKAMQTGQPDEIAEKETPDGRIWHVIGRPLRDDAGEIIGGVEITEDITERVRTERALRESEERYRALYEGSRDAIMILAPPDWNFSSCNPATVKLFGAQDEDEVTSLGPWEVSPEYQPDGRLSSEKAKAMIETAMEEGSHFFEWTHQRLDGTEFPTTVLLTRMEIQGQPLVKATVRDITEQKRMQEELQASEKRFREMVNTLPQFYGEFDLEGQFTFLNETALELLGLTQEDLERGINAAEFVHPKDRERMSENVQKALRGEKTGASEYRMRRKDGSFVPTLVYSSPIIDDGEPVGLRIIVVNITERKQMEEELRASEKRFRDMVNTLPQAYGELDAEGNFTFLNQTAFDVFGYTNDDLEDDLNALEFMVPEDRERALANMQKSLRGQLESPNEYTMVKKDGSLMAALVYSSPIVDDGEPVGLRLILIDITERRRAQEKLRDREQRLNLALKGGELGTWDWDLRTDEVIFNDRWAEMKGYDPDEIDPHLSTWEEMVHPDDMPQVRETLDAYLNGDTEFYEAEFRMQHKSGQWVWILDRGQVIERDDDGNPVRACGTHLDITERKRAEQKLLLRSELLDAANDAIMFHDLEGNFRYVNQTACDRYDYTYEEFTDMNVRQLETPDSAAKVGRRVDKLLKYGQLKFESEQQRNDGSIIPVEINSRVINLDGDRYILSAVRDITERKQAERKLRKALNEAETLNEELQKQTKRANEMAQRAEEANAAKSEFLANMSHEIRTPMNAIIGMTGLLLDSDLGQQQRQYAGTVRASGESLLNIINDILDFSKIEAGRLEMETLDFNLHDMLDDFAQLMGVKAQDKGLEFVCAAHPDVPAHLEGDAGRLRQVLTNLAGNAIKFTEQGEVAVRVGVEDQDEDNVTLGFSVRDTGIGISQDEVDTLFEEFLQVDTSTTRRFGGTGLGLAISRQLVEKMGGEIGAESEKGEGSEFWFTAQFEKQADHELPTKAPDKVPGARILVVDDNATNREILTAQLESWEARVGEAAGGESALDILRGAAQEEDAFDAAILDMQMPHMDGETLGRRIKNDPQLKSIQLVLMTSLGQPEDLQRLRDIGFATCLTKPVTKSELFDCLACILNGGEHEAERDSDVRTDHSLEEIASKDLRILVAEDNITNQQVALGMLEKLGVTADAVANGAEAVEALETIPYDMVLMDVQMPEMDGFEATRHIRDPETGVLDHEIPIIAMTAHAMKGDREKCLEAGMDDYIAKPVERHKLAGLLREWIPERDEPGERDADGAAHSDKQVASEEASEDVPEPVFDREAFIERMMGNEDLAAGVAESFLEDIPERIRRLREYIDAEDNSGVQRQAHTIKGAAANVGGETVRAVAFKIEKGAADGDMPAADSYLPELQAEFERLKEAMEELTE